MPNWIKSITGEANYIVLAVMFWALVGLLVLMTLAVAKAKGNGLEVAVAAVGSVGQVAFAGLVWRLGVRQFEFTKNVTDRQHRIDLHPIRKEIYNKFIEETDYFTHSSNVDYDRIEVYRKLHLDINRAFPREIAAEMFDLYEMIMQLSFSSNDYDKVRTWHLIGQPIEPEAQKLLDKVQAETDAISQFAVQISDAMDDEMSLNP